MWKLRYDLYRQIRSNVENILGGESKGMASYRNEYEKVFHKKWKEVSRDSFFKQLQKSRLILIADFHAHHQSQKAQLRILKGLKPCLDVLGVEFFESTSQKHIDDYLDGRLKERDFLNRIKWKQRWGFPFENYKPIIDWARLHKVKVIGLNKYFKERSSRTLRLRDRHSAKILNKLVSQNQDLQIGVIYGDWHLAPRHLPYEILQQGSLLKTELTTVYQNSEKIFFQILKKQNKVQPDVVQLSSQEFCLMSVAPWVKWQNYLLFLDHESGIDDVDDQADFTDHLSQYVQILCQDLGVGYDVSELSVYSSVDEQFYDALIDQTSPKKRKMIHEMIQREMSFYCPEIKKAYLSRPSVNHASSLAMDVLHSHLSKRKISPTQFPDDFQLAIFLECIRYFGSKLINPKRKTDTFIDIKNTLQTYAFSDQGKEVLQLSVAEKMREMIFFVQRELKTQKFRPLRKSSYLGAARILGGMLGERFYYGYSQGLISKELVLSILSVKAESNMKFKKFYYQFIQQLEEIPEPFLSKTEKL